MPPITVPSLKSYHTIAAMTIHCNQTLPLAQALIARVALGYERAGGGKE